MKKPKFFKQYLSEDDNFLIKTFKTTTNEIVVDITEYVDGTNIHKHFCISKETAIDFANDLLKKANELK